MPRAAGQPGDQVGVDGADGERPVGDAGPDLRLVLGQPGQLGGGEVGVEPQPGQLGDPLLVPCLAQLVRRSGRPPVLPDDRPPRRGERPRSHSTAVSRWLVIPTQLTGSAPAGRCVRAPGGRRPGSPARSPPAACSTQPG